jgi:hypothetical protein
MAVEGKCTVGELDGLISAFVKRECLLALVSDERISFTMDVLE